MIFYKANPRPGHIQFIGQSKTPYIINSIVRPVLKHSDGYPVKWSKLWGAEGYLFKTGRDDSKKGYVHCSPFAYAWEQLKEETYDTIREDLIEYYSSCKIQTYGMHNVWNIDYVKEMILPHFWEITNYIITENSVGVLSQYPNILTRIVGLRANYLSTAEVSFVITPMRHVPIEPIYNINANQLNLAFFKSVFSTNVSDLLCL